MLRLQGEKRHATQHDAVDGKPIEAGVLYQSHHPLAGNDTADKCSDGSGDVGQEQF